MSSTEEHAANGGPRLGLALTVLVCSQLVTALDFNIVYVALKRSLGLDLSNRPVSTAWSRLQTCLQSLSGSISLIQPCPNLGEGGPATCRT